MLILEIDKNKINNERKINLHMIKRKSGMGSHESARMGTDEWLTPPYIIESLGEFDLDLCSPVNRPWDTAKHHYNINDDGLSKDWFGRVWLNPPYGNQAAKWLEKLPVHKNGIALIFARTETRMFLDHIWDHIWDKSDGLLFFKGRLFFHYVNGEKASMNAGAPSVLIAYGNQNVEALKKVKDWGKFIDLR